MTTNNNSILGNLGETVPVLVPEEEVSEVPNAAGGACGGPQRQAGPQRAATGIPLGGTQWGEASKLLIVALHLLAEMGKLPASHKISTVTMALTKQEAKQLRHLANKSSVVHADDVATAPGFLPDGIPPPGAFVVVIQDYKVIDSDGDGDKYFLVTKENPRIFYVLNHCIASSFMEVLASPIHQMVYFPPETTSPLTAVGVIDCFEKHVIRIFAAAKTQVQSVLGAQKPEVDGIVEVILKRAEFGKKVGELAAMKDDLSLEDPCLRQSALAVLELLQRADGADANEQLAETEATHAANV